MSEEKQDRIFQGYNPESAIEISNDILHKGYNPNPLVDTVNQLTQGTIETPPSQPTSDTPPATGGESQQQE